MASRARCKECGRLEPLRISWSSLKTWDECHQKGYLQRSGKRATMENQRVFFPGTVVDRVSRDWLQNDPKNNLGGMPAMVESIMDREENTIENWGGRVSWRNTTDRKEVIERCIRAATILEPHLVQRVLPFNYEADYRFKTTLNATHERSGELRPIILNGAMDFLVWSDTGKYWVYDLKITEDASYWRKTVGQLTFYDLTVVIQHRQKTVETGLFQPLVKKQEYFPYVVTDDQRSQMMQRIVRMANENWNKEFEPNDDMKECGWCNVKHACAKFSPANSTAAGGRVSLLG